MLRLQRRRAHVVIGREHVTVAIRPRLFSRMHEESSVIALSPTPGKNAWAPALAALGDLLASRGNIGSVQVELCDSYARYLIIPWSAGLSGRGEAEALARVRFSDIYGEVAARWTTSVDMRRFGANGLACAVDAQLLEELAAMFDKYHVRALSLQTRFTACVNRADRTLPADAMIVVTGTNHCVVAVLGSGEWQSARLLQVGPAVADIVEVIQREVILQGMVASVPLHLESDTAELSQALADVGIEIRTGRNTPKPTGEVA